ncbi:hypothetical protein V494_03131 [Pseudogymnoascus sp. VKM F-4513 (FW-928)]|nr:hypothetical protein V494_03131 [Pseudogymnoascus sp. VKM F-4513 (FW-928)]
MAQQPQDTAAAAAYYGDLLDSEKKPSRVMVALLTGIAKYIVCSPATTVTASASASASLRAVSNMDSRSRISGTRTQSVLPRQSWRHSIKPSGGTTTVRALHLPSPPRIT